MNTNNNYDNMNQDYLQRRGDSNYYNNNNKNCSNLINNNYNNKME